MLCGFVCLTRGLFYRGLRRMSGRNCEAFKPGIFENAHVWF
ncbi:hypothetical protein O5154_29185, partial [Escherichia coli]|nr:hypothetical protein [Escherichia coli]